MKLFSAVRSHPFTFSVILLLGAFCFSRLPFFLWMGLPGVLPDTFDYYNIADLLRHGNIAALGAQPIEVPLGYPLFLILVNIISGKMLTVVVIEGLVKLLSCIYLAYVCCKYYRAHGILVAFALCIYLMNGFTIRWDTSLYTESLYSSSLVILSALFIHAINKNSTLYFWLLGIWLFVPEFIRPNGLYAYFIIPVLFIYFFARKESLAKYMAIVIPALLLNIGWAGFDVKAFGAFIPGNFIRFGHVHIIPVEQVKPVEPPKATKVQPPASSRLVILETYLSLPEFPQFYYSLWTTRYEDMYVRHQVTDTTYKMYDWQVPVPDSLRRFVYKEFYVENNRFADVYNHLKEHHGIRGIWLTAYHLWYKVDQVLLRNRLLFLFFVLVSIFAAYKWVVTGFSDPVFLIITVLSGLHIISIFVVTFTHPSVQLRYTQVSEFIIYVIFALIPLLLRENNTLRKHA